MTPIPILLYHSIASEASADYAQWSVRPDLFAAHLEVVKSLGFTPLTISELVDAREGGNLPHRPIAVTFDDGRADFAEQALPILQSADVSATLYIVTDLIGATSSWLPMAEETDAAMMTWDDVRAASAAGVEIGSHSSTHVELDVVPRDRLHGEIDVSRRMLADELGTAPRSLSYPHGYHSRAVVQAARAAGFDSACAVRDAWSSTAEDRFALSRMFVWNSTSADDLRSALLAPPERAARPRRLLRAGWRSARWARHRARSRVGGVA